MLYFRFVLLNFIFLTTVFSQGTWLISGRSHPELKWTTLKTNHFNVHYHQGIEEIAKRGATIAEQVRPALLKQVGLDTLPKIDIIFTTEDEIMNGYAMYTNQTFIWVDQNDAAIWLEDVKWLPQVLTHELQHIILFNAIKSTWLIEPWNILSSGTPGWFVEGLAEFMTEKWRPYRADLSHKYHIMTQTEDKMDPHISGYSKLLYLADRFGDSTIVNIIQERTDLKTFRFKSSFKKATGISVERFDEDWRRHMDTYYYSLRSQKEAIEELGHTFTLPVKRVFGFSFTSDSSRIAIIGIQDDKQIDQSLFIATRDTTKRKEKKQILKSILKSKTEKKKKREKVRWIIKEIDFGRFHSGLSWSPDGKKLAYAKYHYGENQSMVWDLREAVKEKDKWSKTWLTDSERATYPTWSPDGLQVAFVAHYNNVSNLYTANTEDNQRDTLTANTEDTQIIFPQWNHSGTALAYAQSGPDGNMDIYTLDIESGIVDKISNYLEADYRPIWHPGDDKISFTSHKGTTPNLYTVDLKTKETIQISDVGEAVWGVEWTPKDSTITAITLADVDTLRLVKINPFREIKPVKPTMRTYFSSWRYHQPDTLLPVLNPNYKLNILESNRYKFGQHPKHLVSFVFPYLDFSGVFGLTAWTDALGKHLFQGMAGFSQSEENSPWYILSYINAQHGPIWGINYLCNASWNYRNYDQSESGLVEKIDGLEVFTQHPLNLGESMSSNHMVITSISLRNRQVVTISDTLDEESQEYINRDSLDYIDLPIPESGREGLFSLQYRWLDRRPHRSNDILPISGKGFLARVKWANKNRYGDFSYVNLETDAFINHKLGKNSALYFRIKTLAMGGNPPAQDYVGLSKDQSIYLPGGTADLGIVSLEENHNIRGWDGVRLGDRLVFGTLEARIPLIPILPVNFFGFGIGNLSGAVISDFGNAWTAGESKPDWITTAGYEVKVALQFYGVPMVFVAYGKAQTIDEWNDNQTPEFYARLVLINPF